MTVPPFPHEELFRQAGPEESLEYLWGRLQDRDLSGEEALALLSVIHRQLGSERADDPKVYFAYTRFMESLSREMPLVHDYVVARWIENRRSAAREKKQTAASESGSADEDGQASLQLGATVPTPAKAPETFPRMIPIAGGDESPEEGGEPEEDEEGAEDQGPRQHAGEAEAADVDEQESEADEGEDAQESVSTGEDGQQEDELADQEEASEAEAAEAEPEPVESEQQTAQDPAETEAGEDDESPEGEADEAEPRASSDEGAEDKGGEAEGEWPAEEVPEPPEATEEMEGEGDEPSPED